MLLGTTMYAVFAAVQKPWLFGPAIAAFVRPSVSVAVEVASVVLEELEVVGVGVLTDWLGDWEVKAELGDGMGVVEGRVLGVKIALLMIELDITSAVGIFEGIADVIFGREGEIVGLDGLIGVFDLFEDSNWETNLTIALTASDNSSAATSE